MSRSLSRPSAAVTAALVLSLTGCAGSEAPGKAAAGASPTVSPSAGASVQPDLFADVPPFTGPAADKFGADNVMAAYKHLVTFHNDNGYITSLMKPRAKRTDFEPAEFSFLKRYMTQSMQADWDKKVEAALAGNGEAVGSVQALTMFDIGGQTTGPGYEVFDDQPTLGQRFSAAKTSVDGKNRLVMEFTFTKDLRVLHDGKKVLLPYTKDLIFAVVPNVDPDVPWLIDGLRFEAKAGEPTPIED